MKIKTGEAVKNFNIQNNKHSVTLKWEAPETEGVTAYEVYRETMLLGTITELYYNDENLISGTYTYNVRPVYEDHNGATSTQEVTFCEGVEDILVPNVTIYPNPANDKVYIETEAEIEEIVVYDVYGRIQNLRNSETQQLSNSVDVADLNSGIYFVKVKTENGNVVKRIVKY